MSRFKFCELPLKGLKVLEWVPFEDSRGRFEKLFCDSSFKELGFFGQVMQINRSVTKIKGTVRGMHFQYPPYAEAKLVFLLKGRIWDVAVDLREGSETFLKWYAVELKEGIPKAFFIPEGFAHGFQALTDGVEMLYIHNAPYAPENEGGLNPFDPKLSITWPLRVTLVSDRDMNLPYAGERFKGIKI